MQSSNEKIKVEKPNSINIQGEQTENLEITRKNFIERLFEETSKGWWDDEGFYNTPNGSFWDPDGYYFNRDGKDKHGGIYDDDLNYVPGEGWNDDNLCYNSELEIELLIGENEAEDLEYDEADEVNFKDHLHQDFTEQYNPEVEIKHKKRFKKKYPDEEPLHYSDDPDSKVIKEKIQKNILQEETNKGREIVFVGFDEKKNEKKEDKKDKKHFRNDHYKKKEFKNYNNFDDDDKVKK